MRHATILALLFLLAAPGTAGPPAPTEADHWLEVLSDPSPRGWNDAIRALDGSELGGRSIRVNEAQDRSGGGGGGGGYRSGGRY